MSPTNINLAGVDLSGAVAPVSGHNYQLSNLGFAHWLDNAYFHTQENNPVLAWSRNETVGTNQIWKFLTYPSGADNNTVFTLQTLSTIQSNSSAVIDGRGGYVRTDPTTNRMVHGGQPQAWKLIEVAPSVYMMSPFEDALSANGTLFATDIKPTFDTQNVTNNQVQLLADMESPEQLWIFHSV